MQWLRSHLHGVGADREEGKGRLPHRQPDSLRGALPSSTSTEPYEPFTAEAEHAHRDKFQGSVDLVMERINELLDPRVPVQRRPQEHGGSRNLRGSCNHRLFPPLKRDRPSPVNALQALRDATEPKPVVAIIGGAVAGSEAAAACAAKGSDPHRVRARRSTVRQDRRRSAPLARKAPRQGVRKDQRQPQP